MQTHFLFYFEHTSLLTNNNTEVFIWWIPAIPILLRFPVPFRWRPTYFHYK